MKIRSPIENKEMTRKKKHLGTCLYIPMILDVMYDKSKSFLTYLKRDEGFKKFFSYSKYTLCVENEDILKKKWENTVHCVNHSCHILT